MLCAGGCLLVPGLMRLCAVRVPPQQAQQGEQGSGGDKHKAIVRPATLSESGLHVKV